MDKITVIGAGLAGCEAAHTLSRLGFSVSLCEMKPVKFTPAQKSENFFIFLQKWGRIDTRTFVVSARIKIYARRREG